MQGQSNLAWHQLSNIMLAVTGGEALYADLGHFNANSIRLSFIFVVSMQVLPPLPWPWPAHQPAYMPRHAWYLLRVALARLLACMQVYPSLTITYLGQAAMIVNE